MIPLQVAMLYSDTSWNMSNSIWEGHISILATDSLILSGQHNVMISLPTYKIVRNVMDNEWRLSSESTENTKQHILCCFYWILKPVHS